MTTEAINIKGIDKAKLLQALFNGSFQHGTGLLSMAGMHDMTLNAAAGIIKEAVERGSGMYFDYLLGRVMKIAIGGDTMLPGLYDRDVGEGAALRIVIGLRGVSAPLSYNRTTEEP